MDETILLPEYCYRFCLINLTPQGEPIKQKFTLNERFVWSHIGFVLRFIVGARTENVNVSLQVKAS